MFEFFSKSYTKYDLSNFSGSLVQGPSKPDLSGCALPYSSRIQQICNLTNYEELLENNSRAVDEATNVWPPDSATMSLSDRPIR